MRSSKMVLACIAALAVILTSACSSTSGSSLPPSLPSSLPGALPGAASSTVAAQAAVSAGAAAATSSPTAPPTLPAGTLAQGAAGASVPVTGSSTGATRAAIDPCKKLTIADVQPYFTVPIATELPSPLQSDTTKGCEWSAAAGGGLATTLDILVIVGQDAQDRWDLANQTGHPEKLSGVGDESEHLTGQTDMWAMTGAGANAIWCGVTTVGWKELAGHLELADPANIPDATAIQIADQYGLLCNKIFGSGNTSPTMTAPVPTGAAAVVTASGPTVAAAAAGGVMTGTTVPVPQGMDCSGTKTAKNTTGGLECDQKVPDSSAAYNFFLQALPKAGYAVNSKHYEKGSDGRVVAGITFSGGQYPGFNFISIDGNDVDITLQLD